MESLKVTCPSCRGVITAKELHFGKTVNCPGCKNPMKIPDPTKAVREAEAYHEPSQHAQATNILVQTNQTVYCRNCGKPMAALAAFCVSCGVPVNTGADDNITDIISPSSGFSTAHMTLLIIGTILIPFIGIIGGILGLIFNKGKKKSQSGILLGIGAFMAILYGLLMQV